MLLGWLKCFYKTMQMKHFLMFVEILFAAFSYAEEPSDSIVSHKSLFVIPHVSYQQETSVAPGIAYGYY